MSNDRIRPQRSSFVSGGPEDLARAFEYAQDCVAAVCSLQAFAVSADQISPSRVDLKAHAVAAYKKVALELFQLVVTGVEILSPVNQELTKAAGSTAGAHGAHGPNAHRAICKLADGVLSNLMAMGGGYDLGGITLENLPNLAPFRKWVTSIERAELDRLLAEAEREYHVACRNREPASPQAEPEGKPAGTSGQSAEEEGPHEQSVAETKTEDDENGSPGGRPKKWDHYLEFADGHEAQNPGASDIDIFKAYRQQYGNAFKTDTKPAPKLGTLKQARGDRKRRRAK